MIRLTPEQNGQVIDLDGQVILTSRRDPAPGIVFEPGTHGIMLRNFTLRGRGIRIHGSHHTLEDFEVDAFGSGVFVESGSHHNTIQRGDIKAGAVGIYLEHASHHNHVLLNRIHDCGYWSDQAHLPFRLPRFGWERREGIAVDASTDNVIERNVLRNNAFAGITLYKNCGEYGQAKRQQGANNNVIFENVIEGSRVKVWNKAREWRDLVTWGCSCQGEWVPIWKVPKQPYQQWFNFACLTTGLFIKGVPVMSPFRWRIWKVADEAEGNMIGEGQ